MGRTTARHMKKINKGKVFITTLLTMLIVMIVSVGILITPWGNSTARKFSSNRDAPLDYAVKKLFVNKVNSSKEGTIHPTIITIKEVTESMPMSSLVEILNDDRKAIAYLTSDMGKTDEYANLLVAQVKRNKLTSKLIKNVTESKWLEAMEDLNELQTSGTIDEISKNIDESAEKEAKKLQDEAREILKEE